MVFQFCQAASLQTSREHLRHLDLALHHQQNSCGREVNWTETKNGTICHCHLKLRTKIYFFSRMLILTTVDSLFSVKALILYLHCNITLTTEAFMPGHQTPYLVKMQCMETELFLSRIKLLSSHGTLDNVLHCTDHTSQVSNTIQTSAHTAGQPGRWNNPGTTCSSLTAQVWPSEDALGHIQPGSAGCNSNVLPTATASRQEN